MAQVVNEPPDAVDAVVQIKEEVDGELRWSKPTHCTIQLPTVASEPDIPVDFTFQPTEDDQTPSAEVNTQYSVNIKVEPDAVFHTSVQSDHEDSTHIVYGLQVKTEADEEPSGMDTADVAKPEIHEGSDCQQDKGELCMLQINAYLWK